MRRAYAFTVVVIAALAWTASAAEPGPRVELSIQSAGPREVEDTTTKAIVRDYAVAWKALATALSENRAQALDAGFVGDARNKLGSRIEEQKRTGLGARYVDRGHKLEALFYSPDGSAMQLRDTAQLEVQVFDGGQLVSSQELTQDYLVVMTVGEGRWKVRVLQEVP